MQPSNLSVGNNAQVVMRHKHALLLIRGQTPSEILRERIAEQGSIEGDKLKLNSFLNHQIDCHLMHICGQQLALNFRGWGVTRLLTHGPSGSILAQNCALHMGVPLVIASEKPPLSLPPNKVYSKEDITKGRAAGRSLHISSEFICKDDHVLVVDDILATGNTTQVLSDLVELAGATVAGYGFLVEKSYEEGRKNLRQGVPVAALTVISSIASGKIEFGEPEPSCPDSSKFLLNPSSWVPAVPVLCLRVASTEARSR